MTDFARQCRMFSQISLGMLAVGMLLPLALALAAPGIIVSPFVWNVLQIGGLFGFIVFWVITRFTRNSADSGPAPTLAKNT